MQKIADAKDDTAEVLRLVHGLEEFRRGLLIQDAYPEKNPYEYKEWGELGEDDVFGPINRHGPSVPRCHLRSAPRTNAGHAKTSHGFLAPASRKHSMLMAFP